MGAMALGCNIQEKIETKIWSNKNCIQDFVKRKEARLRMLVTKQKKRSKTEDVSYQDRQIKAELRGTNEKTKKVLREKKRKYGEELLKDRQKSYRNKQRSCFKR
ncbi:hypothetical protein QE152_g32240 [Popillia japonica]|uniref:Uncharacterized protein n=1 Tax=Popillia japonica TaxID=7064 RepID=A0AAW1IZZ6_POPJA